MFCTKCGKELPENSSFCTACGALVTDDDAPVLSAQQEAPVSFASPADEIDPLSEASPLAEPSALALSQEDAQLLSEEPAELLSSISETIELPEPLEAPAENILSGDTLEIPAIPEPPVSNDTPGTVLLSDEPDPLAGFNDNNDTIQIPAQPDGLTAYNSDSGTFSRPAASPEPAPAPAPANGGFAPPPPPPAPEQPAPDAKADKKSAKKHDTPAKIGGGRIFGASIISFFAIVMLLAASLMLAIKLGANGSIIRSRTEKLSSEALFSSQFDGREFSDTLYRSLGFRTATNGAADESSFKRFMVNSDFRQYAGRTVKDYLDYIIGSSKDDPSISSGDFVNDFIRANEEGAADEFKYELTEADYELLEANLDKDHFTRSMDVQEWSKDIGFPVGSFRIIFSYITICILFALVIVFLIWIVVIVDKRGKHVTGFFGNILFTVGLLLLLAGPVIVIGSAIAYAFTHALIFYLGSNVLLPFGIVLFCIGAAELVIGYIFKKVRKGIKKKAKKAAAAANGQN